MPKLHLHEKIKHSIKVRGLAHSQVALEIGLESRATVTNWCTGFARPSAVFFSAFLTLLDKYAIHPHMLQDAGVTRRQITLNKDDLTTSVSDLKVRINRLAVTEKRLKKKLKKLQTKC